MTLINPIPGDRSATISWEITWNDLSPTEYMPVALQFNINDVPESPYDFENQDNKLWSTQVVPVDKIGDAIYTITGLENDENYLIYGFMVFRKKTDPFDIITIYSEKIGPIIPRENPLPVSLTQPGVNSGQFDGKQLNSNTTFMIQIELPENFYTHTPPDHLMIMLIDNNNNTQNVQRKTIKVLWNDLINVDDNDLLKRYLLTDLEADLAYEVSAFTLRGYQVSTVSNTIPVVATQKASVPGNLSAIFNYETGNVQISSIIQEKGATPEDLVFKVNLYRHPDGVLLKTFTIDNVFDPNTPVTFPYTFTFDTLGFKDDESNDIFNIGQQSIIKLTTFTSYGESDSSNIFTFTPVKRLQPSTVKLSATEGAITASACKIEWTLPTDLYNQTISKLQLFKTTTGSNETGGDFTGVTPIEITNLAQINALSYQFTTLTTGEKYWFAMKIAVTDPNPSPAEYVLSDLSDDNVFATPYDEISAPTMLISYLEEDVDKQAKLTWQELTAAERDNLTVVSYNIYAYDLISNVYTYKTSVASDVLTYTVTGLSNGASYGFAVNAVVTTLGSNSYVDGDGPDFHNVQITSPYSTVIYVTPWSKPSSPTFTITDYGNHYVNFSISDNSVLNNGLTETDITRYIVYYEPSSGGGQQQMFTTNVNEPNYITGLVNNIEYKFKAFVEYNNPNWERDPSTSTQYIESYITNPELLVTPNFKDTDVLSPSNIVVSGIGDNRATISWTAPVVTIAGLDQKLTFSNYKLEIFTIPMSENSSAVYSTVLANNITEHFINDPNLVNGDSFVCVVSAIYDDTETTGITETLTAPSEPSSVFIPFTNSDPVTNIVYTNIGDGTVTFTWTAPSFTGGNNIAIKSYQSYYEKYNSVGTLIEQSEAEEHSAATGPVTYNFLENGFNYKFYVRVVTQDPNGSAPVFSDYASSTTNAYPFKFDDEVNSINNFAVTFIGSTITLGWDANISLQGYPFNYLIYKGSGTSTTPNFPTDGSELVATILNTANPNTSYTDSAVLLGTGYTYKAQIKFVNPNDDTDIRYGPYTLVEDAIPYNDPSNPTGLVGTPASESLSLQWTRETAVNGLPVQGYNIYTFLENSPNSETDKNNWTKQNGENLYTNTDPYNVYSLANGVGVKVKVTVVTQNINDDNTSDPTDAAPNAFIESDFFTTPMITVWPFTNPEAPVAYVNLTEVTNQKNIIYWNEVTNTGGFNILGYNVYLADGTKLNTNIIQANTLKYDHTGLTNGTSYSYYVKAIVANKNDGDNHIESVASNVVTRIPFNISNAPSIVDPIEEMIEEKIRLIWDFTNNRADAGLLDNNDRFVITMQNLSQPERNTTLYVDNINDRNLEITVIPGHTYSFKMVAQFANPNDTALTVDSNFSNIVQVATFGYATPHIDILSQGYNEVKLLINPYNDIDLKDGTLVKYIVSVKDMNGQIITNYPIVVAEEVRDSNNPVILNGLTNGTEYRIEVITETTQSGVSHFGDVVYVIGKPGLAPAISDVVAVPISEFNITFIPNTYKPSFIHFFIEKHSGQTSITYKVMYVVSSPAMSGDEYRLSLVDPNNSTLTTSQITRISVIAGNEYGNSETFQKIF